MALDQIYLYDNIVLTQSVGQKLAAAAIAGRQAAWCAGWISAFHPIDKLFLSKERSIAAFGA
jgi:hypothetical protein